jgi:hypothetical protein
VSKNIKRKQKIYFHRKSRWKEGGENNGTIV